MAGPPIDVGDVEKILSSADVTTAGCLRQYAKMMDLDRLDTLLCDLVLKLILMVRLVRGASVVPVEVVVMILGGEVEAGICEMRSYRR
jgi:hypothetical protein